MLRPLAVGNRSTLFLLDDDQPALWPYFDNFCSAFCEFVDEQGFCGMRGCLASTHGPLRAAVALPSVFSNEEIIHDGVGAEEKFADWVN